MSSTTDSHQASEEAKHTPGLLERHRFFLLVAGSIVTAVLLVMVSLALYVSSGTAQLDLSLPGNAEIREQVRRDDEFREFRASGRLDAEAMNEFELLYQEQLSDAESIDAFGGDVLSPEALQIRPSQ